MRYQRLFAQIWLDEKFRSLSDDAKLLYIYIISSPHSNALGAFVLPLQYIEADLGWPRERLAEPLAELFRNGFVNRSETVNLTVVKNHLKYNPIDNPNQAKAAMRIIDCLPFDKDMFRCIINEIQKTGKPFMEPLAKRLAERLGEPLPEPYAKPEYRIQNTEKTHTSVSEPTETDSRPPNEISEPRSVSANGIPYEEIRAAYNEICTPAGLPACRFLTDRRRSAIRSCWRQEPGRTDDPSWWQTYWHHVTRSDFLCGRVPGGRQWRANFDWLVKISNFVRVREGAYH